MADISVDTEFLNSEEFKEFLGIVHDAKQHYQNDSYELIKFPDVRGQVDEQIRDAVLNAHPLGLALLVALADVGGGDSKKVDYLGQVSEIAEESNVEDARFTTGDVTTKPH